MAAEEFDLRNFGALGHGTLGGEVDHHLETIRDDLRERPSLEKPRTLTITLEFVPVVNKNANKIVCSSAKVAAKARVKIPDSKVEDAVVSVTDKAFLYNQMAPENPNQGTFDDIETTTDFEADTAKAETT